MHPDEYEGVRIALVIGLTGMFVQLLISFLWYPSTEASEDCMLIGWLVECNFKSSIGRTFSEKSGRSLELHGLSLIDSMMVLQPAQFLAITAMEFP